VNTPVLCSRISLPLGVSDKGEVHGEPGLVVGTVVRVAGVHFYLAFIYSVRNAAMASAPAACQAGITVACSAARTNGMWRASA
jgi:hypothetical protein